MHHCSKMVVILASLSLSLCIAAVIVIPLLSTIVVGFWPSLSLCVAVVIVASSSQDGHRHKMVIIMALMSLSLCVAVVVVVPLLSTIVFVGLLDVGHHPLSLCVAVVVVASSSQDGRRHGVVVIVSLCCCCCHCPLVCQPLFLLDCWILAIIVISLCCCCHTIVVVVVVVVVVVCFGSSSLSLWLGQLSIDISLFLFCILFHVLIEFEIADREIIEK